MTATPAKLGIVFLHHKRDGVTLNNLQSFRDHNPGATIVTMSAEDCLPGGYSILTMPGWAERWREHTAKPGLRARSTDLLVFAWYQNRRESCDRWLLVEWDSFCACSAEEFFGELIGRDAVASSVHVPGQGPSWWWFCKRETLPAALRPHAAGISPFSFVLVSNRALEAMSRMFPPGELGEGNGELRFGSLAYASGFTPVANRTGLGYNSWSPLPENHPLGRGMWHPVKWLVPRTSMDAANPVRGSARYLTVQTSEFEPQLEKNPDTVLKADQLPLTVLTFWKRGWNEVQRSVLRWFQEETFPVGTSFVWVAPDLSTTEIVFERSWLALNAVGRDYNLELVDVTGAPVLPGLEEQQLLFDVHMDAFSRAKTHLMLVVDDDKLPALGSVYRLLTTFDYLPSNTGGLTAACASSASPSHICATGRKDRPISWDECRRSALIEAYWIGSGFTLYRVDAVKASLQAIDPLNIGSAAGAWSRLLCREFRRRGDPVFVDAQVIVGDCAPITLNINQEAFVNPSPTAAGSGSSRHHSATARVAVVLNTTFHVETAISVYHSLQKVENCQATLILMEGDQHGLYRFLDAFKMRYCDATVSASQFDKAIVISAYPQRIDLPSIPLDNHPLLRDFEGRRILITHRCNYPREYYGDDKVICLSPLGERYGLKFIYLCENPALEEVPSLGADRVFLVQGKFHSNRRNLEILYDALGNIRLGAFRVMLVGESADRLKPVADERLTTHSNLSELDFYSVCRQAHFVIPLIDGQIASGTYVRGRFSTSYSISFASRKPLLTQRAMGDIYQVPSVVFDDSADFQRRFLDCITMSDANYLSMVEAYDVKRAAFRRHNRMILDGLL